MVRFIRAALRLLGWGAFWFVILLYLILIGSVREGIAMIEITQRVKYDQQYEVGQKPDHLSLADEQNLIAGGYAIAITEEGEKPAGGSGQEDSNANTGGTGSNAQTEPPSGKGEEGSLACPHGCRDGKPFSNAASLGAHLAAKHR